MPFATEERRRFPRRWVAWPVRIHSGGSSTDGVTINISDGGMLVFAATNFPAGSEVELVFRPPETDEPVRLCGVVRRRAVYLYAIEFVNLDAGAMQSQRMAAGESQLGPPFND